MIATAAAVIVVIKNVHTVVLIREEYAHLRTASLNSAESAIVSSVFKRKAGSI